MPGAKRSIRLAKRIVISLQSQKACYSRHSGHAYQVDYPKTHHEYAERNRKLQAIRNQRRLRKPGALIVNADAFVVRLRAVAELQAFLLSNTG